MNTVNQKYIIKAPIEKVWDGLTNSKLIDKWGAGPSKMEPVKGFEFSLWGGDIFGKNIKVIKNKKLVQEWFAGKWKKPSIVTFILRKAGEKTVVELNHTDIPDSEFKDIENGWKDYYMNPLKELVEEN